MVHDVSVRYFQPNEWPALWRDRFDTEFRPTSLQDGAAKALKAPILDDKLLLLGRLPVIGLIGNLDLVGQFAPPKSAHKKPTNLPSPSSSQAVSNSENTAKATRSAPLKKPSKANSPLPVSPLPESAILARTRHRRRISRRTQGRFRSRVKRWRSTRGCARHRRRCTRWDE